MKIRTTRIAAAAAVLTAFSAGAAPKRPNIVLVIADDCRHYDLGCYGSPDAITPNIDRLAAQGLRFERFFQATAMSSPTRHCLLRRSARPANRRPSRPADETDPHRATRLCGARLRHRSDQANAQSSTPSKRTRNAQPGTQRAACVGNCALPSSRATALRALMRHSIALYGQDA